MNFKYYYKGDEIKAASAFPNLFSFILLMWMLITVIIKKAMHIQGERKHMMSYMYAQQAVLQLPRSQTSLFRVCAIKFRCLQNEKVYKETG